MATVILRPDGDISLQHKCSSGSNGYLMINEEQPDNDATYIYQLGTTTSLSYVTSEFHLTPPPELLYSTVTGIRITYSVTTKTTGTNSFVLKLVINDNEDYSATQIGPPGTGAYSTYTSDERTWQTAVYDSINNSLSNGVYPSLSLSLSTGISKNKNKDDDGYMRITQIYLELDYEPAPPSIYMKKNGTWKKYSSVYKKQNGLWVPQDAENLKQIFVPGINYVKRN